jgi:hypothetical protein
MLFQDALGIGYGLGYLELTEGFHVRAGHLSQPGLAEGLATGNLKAPSISAWSFADFSLCSELRLMSVVIHYRRRTRRGH